MYRILKSVAKTLIETRLEVKLSRVKLMLLIRAGTGTCLDGWVALEERKLSCAKFKTFINKRSKANEYQHVYMCLYNDKLEFN